MWDRRSWPGNFDRERRPQKNETALPSTANSELPEPTSSKVISIYEASAPALTYVQEIATG